MQFTGRDASGCDRRGPPRRELAHLTNDHCPTKPQASTVPSDSFARERWKLMRVADDIAEKLDELERRLDPDRPPPRHAAMAYHRLRSMIQDD